MIEPALYVTLFLGGLGASLHCVGMCGPILAGIASVDERRGPLLEVHAGRLWTYALLGLAAGGVGARLLPTAHSTSWPHYLGVVLGLGVSLIGFALFSPRLRAKLTQLAGACPARLKSGPLGTLARAGRLGRFLLGTLQGLIPCGLVYASLAVAATLGSAQAGALGMLAFGLGTIPALVGTSLVLKLLPWRLANARLAAWALLLSGLWIVARSGAPLVSHAPPACHTPTVELRSNASSLLHT